MINNEVKAAVEAQMAGLEAPDLDLASLSHHDLRKLRRAIDRLLPSESLGDIDLPKELLAQYRMVKDLQEDVLSDDVTPANQKAQVAGQVASTLQQLTKMQTDFYTSERFRSIENLMIKFMKAIPLEKAKEFLDEYEKLAETNG